MGYVMRGVSSDSLVRFRLGIVPCANYCRVVFWSISGQLPPRIAGTGEFLALRALPEGLLGGEKTLIAVTNN